jgi:hypothetical protein
MELKPVPNPEEPQDRSYQGWLVQKTELLKKLQQSSGGVYPIAKKFKALKECEDSEEVEAEKRAFGLAPPAELRCRNTDTRERKEIKKNLWRCVIKGYCSRKISKMTDIPPFRLHLPADNKCWDALAKIGFYPHGAGPQFICLAHLRAEGEAVSRNSNSSKVLRHWMLYRQMLPGAEVLIPTNLKPQKEVRDSIILNEKHWFALRNQVYKSIFPPKPESNQTPNKG